MTNATYTISQSPEWRLQIISFARPRVFQTQRCIYNSHIRRREGEHFTLEKLEPKIFFFLYSGMKILSMKRFRLNLTSNFFLPLPLVFVSPCPSEQRFSPPGPSYVISCRRGHFQYGGLTCGVFSRGKFFLSQWDKEQGRQRLVYNLTQVVK